mgnify:CR=1 FL=1
MAYLPQIPAVQRQTLTTTNFYGLNRGMVVAEGEMEDMRNMTSDNYPILSTRQRRRTPAFPGVEGGGHVHCVNPQGLLGTDRLIMADDGVIYVDGVEHSGVRLSTDASMQPKMMVAMGAYVCIWPDKVYLNLANPDDYGPMGARWAHEGDAVISAMMTRKDGRDYDMEDVTISDTAPEDPVDKQLWIDTSGSVDQLMQYSVIYAEWIQVATTYIKIQATGIGKGIREGDVIHLSGVAEKGAETAAAEGMSQDSETLSFTAEDFNLSSSFTTTHQGGTSWVSTTPTIAERTKTIAVSGIPDGAVVLGAVVKFNASSPLYSTRLLTVNGKSAQVGANEIPVEVEGNGDVSLLFRFQSGNNATVSGSHAGSIKFSGITLEVTWATTGATEEQMRKQLDALNTTNVVYGAGDDYIIVAGTIRRNVTLAETLVAEIKIPDLDYVTEANNRLWGCSYARADGVLTNEIRACALGDFRNWYSFQGTSMDSYTVSIGSDGKFTGACTVRGQPIFWKETCLHKISGTEPANFTLNTTMCRGVQDGCWRSLAMVGEMLLYKARMDVMAYDGSMPYSIGEKLGRTRWYEASGAAHLDKYYLCMRDESMTWSVYVYDTIKGLWHREDDVKAVHMATVSGDMYMIEEGGEPVLRCVGGVTGTVEEPFDWMVRFGVFGVTEPRQKYVSRFNIRARLAAGARMSMQIMYDSDGVWHDMGVVRTPVLRTFLLPIVPRRCDHMQVVLKGHGDAKIYSISRTYAGGGDGGYGPISRPADA